MLTIKTKPVERLCAGKLFPPLASSSSVFPPPGDNGRFPRSESRTLASCLLAVTRQEVCLKRRVVGRPAADGWKPQAICEQHKHTLEANKG